MARNIYPYLHKLVEAAHKERKEREKRFIEDNGAEEAKITIDDDTKEKTAKELFEKLGWECEIYDLSDLSTNTTNLEEISKIKYEKGSHFYLGELSDYYEIVFDLIDKEIRTYAEGLDNEPLDFIATQELLKTINKQVEELGWKEKENE